MANYLDSDYTGADMWREYCAKYGAEDARKICNSYLDMQWATGRAQSDADVIALAEGCLLDSMVAECKRGTAFLFEEYASEWASRYHVFFVPYKEQANNPEYMALWDRFDALQAAPTAE